MARYHRGNLPQRSHIPYVELDQDERLLVNKLAALLRVANALDAEHLQKVQDIRLVRTEKAWLLELIATGDVTMPSRSVCSVATPPSRGCTRLA